MGGHPITKSSITFLQKSKPTMSKPVSNNTMSKPLSNNTMSKNTSNNNNKSIKTPVSNVIQQKQNPVNIRRPEVCTIKYYCHKYKYGSNIFMAVICIIIIINVYDIAVIYLWQQYV